jgi:hypothetical protein
MEVIRKLFLLRLPVPYLLLLWEEVVNTQIHMLDFTAAVVILKMQAARTAAVLPVCILRVEIYGLEEEAAAVMPITVIAQGAQVTAAERTVMAILQEIVITEVMVYISALAAEELFLRVVPQELRIWSMLSEQPQEVTAMAVLAIITPLAAVVAVLVTTAAAVAAVPVALVVVDPVMY